MRLTPLISLLLASGIALALPAWGADDTPADKATEKAEANKDEKSAKEKKEAPKVELEILGLGGGLFPDEMEGNVRNSLSLGGESCDAPDWRANRLLQRVNEEATGALQALGYYGGEINASMRREKECWRAKIEVKPGEPTKVSRVSIRIEGEGERDAEFLKLISAPPLKEGEVLHHGRYDGTKSRITGIAAEHGYFDGEWCGHEMRVDPERRQAEIDLCYRTGPRYKIGEVTLAQEGFEDDLIRKYITIAPGQPFDSKKLNEDYQRLSNTNYFERVDLRPLVEQRGQGQVPVEVRLANKARHMYKASIAYATDTGIGVTGGYENRRVNAQGHQLNADISLSMVRSELTGQYNIPLYGGSWDKLGFTTGYMHEDTDDTVSDLFKIGGRIQRPRGDWTETVSLDLQEEKSDISGEEVSGEWTLLLIPGISWTTTQADDLLRPRHGQKLKMELRGASDLLLSDVNFAQVLSGGKWVRTVGKGLVIGRVDAGATWTDDFHRLPTSIRFFAGGDNSVRGYEYKKLAPRDDEGNVLGGQYLLALSAEYEHPITDTWGAAVFADGGNAFDDFSEGLSTGIGMGARWYSPVGPLRADLAFPLDDPGTSFRVHVSLGAIF